MTAPAESLVVRQHERVSCALPAEVAVAPECAEGVSLSRSVGDAAGRVVATATDVSRGGMGLRCSTFFPRHTLLVVRLPENHAGGTGPWEATVRVERVSMVDRGPTYYLGTSIPRTEEGARCVEALLKELSRPPKGGTGA